MGLQNGNALFFTLRENPKAMSLRHFIPFLFLVSLVIIPLLSLLSEIFIWLYFLELFVYISLDFFFSFVQGEGKYGVVNIWLYPAFHIVYGFGSLLSLLGVKLY